MAHPQRSPVGRADPPRQASTPVPAARLNRYDVDLWCAVFSRPVVPDLRKSRAGEGTAFTSADSSCYPGGKIFVQRPAAR